MKWKLLLGFSITSALAGAICVFALLRLHSFESLMQAVNDSYVPVLRTLNQMESSYALMESDLNKSVEEGIFRPSDSSLEMMAAKIDYIQKVIPSSGQGYDSVRLKKAFEELRASIAEMQKDWPNRLKYAEKNSLLRASFRHELKTAVRDMDREIRISTITAQSEMSKSAIIITLALAFCLFLAIFSAYWIHKSLRPIDQLAQSMRRISKSGITNQELEDLNRISAGTNEVSVLRNEYVRMAHSLHSQAKEIEIQQAKLEQAHLEMAKQNVALRKAQTKLLHSEKLNLAGKLAAQMAHEIRNPLHALGLHFDLMEEMTHNLAEVKQLMQPIRNEIDRMMKIAKSYLDLAKEPKPEPTALNLNDIVEEVHALFLPMFKEKGVTLVCDLENIPAINGDRSLLLQVLVNLVKNALEATEDKSGEAKNRFVRIFTSHMEERKQVLLQVEDNGKGISSEHAQAIFTPFFTTKADGTGLGLAHSKKIVELQAGEIQFQSEQEQGTKFYVHFPAIG